MVSFYGLFDFLFIIYHLFLFLLYLQTTRFYLKTWIETKTFSRIFYFIFHHKTNFCFHISYSLLFHLSLFPFSLIQTVLATGSADHTVKLWDIEQGEEKMTLTGNPENIQDMKWSYDGSMMATSCKDKQMRIFDARTDAVVQSCKPHEGSKCFKTCWLGKSNNIVTVGFTRQSKRQFMIWDHRDLSKAIHTESLDQSAGVIMPFYDEDSNVMYLAGKGDGNIRFFEMVPEKPFCFSLSEYRAGQSQKGIAFIPKRHCDTKKCEVMRAIKLTSNSAEPLSFIIPRKSDRFQIDIYPDTRSGIPALEAADFFAGAKDFTPKLQSMDPAKQTGGETKQSMPSNIKSKGQIQKELDAALARIAELEAEVATLKA